LRRCDNSLVEPSETLEPTFEPLDSYTTAGEDFGPLWPVEHRQESAWPADDTWPPPDPRWMVRSPWPGVSVREVVEALFTYLPGDFNSRYNPPVRDRIVEEFFQLDGTQVAALAAAALGEEEAES
jgi:hypothetical protein